jgi:hypothetical protein
MRIAEYCKHAQVRSAERSLARNHQLTLHVIIGVLIGVKHILRCNLSQSLDVWKVKVKMTAQRES